MEEYGETKDKDYPRGRGYVNDYMRGGEVFGGYGYSKRAEYDRPRGEGEGRPDEECDGEADDDDEGDDPASARRSAREGDGDGESESERFPQDERAGGWDVPHDLVEEGEAPERSASPPEQSPGRDHDRDPEPDARLGIGADAPEPKLEGTYGDTGGNRLHSRSYYVTQAQLQHRVVEKEK